MSEIYERTGPAASDPFLDALRAELAGIPEIATLDDYSHYFEQLKHMRARNTGEYVEGRFAMEMAVHLRLMEWEERVGLPYCTMPKSDGRGGLVAPSPIPPDWLREANGC